MLFDDGFIYKKRLSRLLKGHFDIVGKFAFFQRGTLIHDFAQNSKYLSSLNFCKRDFGFAV